MELKKYLIGYIAPNQRVMSKIICADNQKQAVDEFYKTYKLCEIIAVSVWEN